jgi:catechol 2,3-dioxygenase-like lactoylglutathione lyase family enzyme
VIERVNHIILTVSDLKKAVYFYESILGLKKIKEWPNIAFFDVGGVRFGLAVDGKLGIHLLVDDVDKAYQRLRDKQVKFVSEPKDQPWGERQATFIDPDGNTFTIEQTKK